MSFLDKFSDYLFLGYDGMEITAQTILFSLAMSCVLGFFVFLVYRAVTRKTFYSLNFNISLIAMCMITCGIMLAIQSNIVLSLGMVGALSIVRFRTAVKDASDTAFLFWAVAAGITSGAGFYLLTLIGCLFIGCICVISVVLCDRMTKPFLLVIRAETPEIAEQAEQVLASAGMRYSLSSLLENTRYTEAIYELGLSEGNKKTVSVLKELPGVTNISLVDCRKG